jgi:integrase
MARRSQAGLFIWRDPNFYENFTVRGRRFRATLQTGDREEAAVIAADRYAAALRGDYRPGAAPPRAPETAALAAATPLSVPAVVEVADANKTLHLVFSDYWEQHGQHVPSAPDIWRMTACLLDGTSKKIAGTKRVMPGLGRDTRVKDLSLRALKQYVARRRAFIANASINRELVLLRATLNWAKADGVPVPEFRWKKDGVLLEETGPREHILSAEEEERLFVALRPDYHPMVRFALLSGMRLANVVSLTWRQVDLGARRIALRLKSKKPGGELHYVPISGGMLEILEGERGHDFQRVFTYVCDRNRLDPKRNIRQTKGQRYPFTHDGWRKDWDKALGAAGVEDFRFHDLRHTAATRTLNTPRGNLQLVQKMLGHKDISTTLRYTKTDLDGVLAAMNEAEIRHRIRHKAVSNHSTKSQTGNDIN